jgi:hypothetical protein
MGALYDHGGGGHHVDQGALVRVLVGKPNNDRDVVLRVLKRREECENNLRERRGRKLLHARCSGLE